MTQVNFVEALAIDGQCTLTPHQHGACYRSNCNIHMSRALIDAAMYQGVSTWMASSLVAVHQKHHDEKHPPYKMGGPAMDLHVDPLDGEWVEISCGH